MFGCFFCAANVRTLLFFCKIPKNMRPMSHFLFLVRSKFTHKYDGNVWSTFDMRTKTRIYFNDKMQYYSVRRCRFATAKFANFTCKNMLNAPLAYDDRCWKSVDIYLLIVCLFAWLLFGVMLFFSIFAHLSLVICIANTSGISIFTMN